MGRMFEEVVVATDGSASVDRAVSAGLDLAERFEATVHALYVVDEREVSASPATVRGQLEGELERRGRDAVADVAGRTDRTVTTAVRTGDPSVAIVRYADAVGADLVVTGTRGRHGEGRLLLGSVAERVVRRCPVPVLTVRQLTAEE